MKIYRIYPVGPVPPDLGDRVSAIHAAAILRSEAGDVPAKVQSPDRKSKEPPSKLGGIWG